MTPTPTTTGPGSTSFFVWVVTFLGGVASAVEGVVTSGTAAHTAVYGGAGVLLALGGTLGKLFHDKGLHVATITAAGSDIAAQLPQLKTDIATAVGFAEKDVPELQGVIKEITPRVAALEAKIGPDVAAIEVVVRSILAGIGTPPPAPVVPPAPAAA
jgi:hypothetical protein